MLAALSWAPVQKHDGRRVRGGASDAVKETDAIQDNVMQPRRERGGSLRCDGLPFRSRRGARREKTKDQSLKAHVRSPWEQRSGRLYPGTVRSSTTESERSYGRKPISDMPGCLTDRA